MRIPCRTKNASHRVFPVAGAKGVAGRLNYLQDVFTDVCASTKSARQKQKSHGNISTHDRLIFAGLATYASFVDAQPLDVTYNSNFIQDNNASIGENDRMSRENRPRHKTGHPAQKQRAIQNDCPLVFVNRCHEPGYAKPACYSSSIGSPSHPASRADSHQKACPLSLQFSECECAQSISGTGQSSG